MLGVVVLVFYFCDCIFYHFCDCSLPPDDPYQGRALSAVFCCVCLSFSQRETLFSFPVSALLLRKLIPPLHFFFRSDCVVAFPRCNSVLRRCETICSLRPIVLLFFESVDLAGSRSTRCAPHRRAVVPCSLAFSACLSRREFFRLYCHLCDRKTNLWSRNNWISCS